MVEIKTTDKAVTAGAAKRFLCLKRAAGLGLGEELGFRQRIIFAKPPVDHVTSAQHFITSSSVTRPLLLSNPVPAAKPRPAAESHQLIGERGCGTLAKDMRVVYYLFMRAAWLLF